MKKIALTNQFIAGFCICVLLLLSASRARAQEKPQPAAASANIDAAQPKFALLVGITKYKSDKVNKIDGCENNVPLLADALIKDYGFDKNNVAVLLNEAAKKDAIISSFRSHLIENAGKSKAAGKEAVVVYYFCGHGSQYDDQDGDENDKKDETFVAHDSRTGDVFDILDDELDDLKAELREFTKNTTLILESCHSGTGSRDGETELISQETAEDARKNPAPYKRKFKPSTEADAETYTEIAASLSSNTAKSETAQFCQCDKPLSLMTKALIQGLKRATHATTYRSLVREVAGEVATQSRQEPQVEGNRDTVLFGGAAKRAKPYIEIEKILPNNQIEIRAGTILGLKEGSQISVYASSSQTNAGKEDGWLVNGIVAQVGNSNSIVQLPEGNAKVKEITIASHVVLASPVFGGGAVFLSLNPAGNVKTLGADDATLHKRIEKQLADNALFERQVLKLAASDKLSPAERKDSKGIVRLRKGIFKEIFSETKGKIKVFNQAAVQPRMPAVSCDGDALKENPEKERFPAADALVYYLDDGEAGGLPLFGKTFAPADANLAEDIAETVKTYAYQRILLGLDNAVSTLRSQIKLTLEFIPADAIKIKGCKNGKLIHDKVEGKFKGFEPFKDNRVLIDSAFQIKIKNVSGEARRKADKFASGEPLHLSVLALTNDGEIKVVFSTKNDPLQDDGEQTVALRTGAPTGIERFVVVVSKPEDARSQAGAVSAAPDFSFYEVGGSRRDGASILEQLLTQSGTITKRAGTVSDEPDKWDVIHLELNVVAEKTGK